MLKDECRVFTRYLVKQVPNSYILDKYCSAHSVHNIFHNLEVRAFDAVLLKIARLHPVTTRLVDVYTAVFLRDSVVRRKLVLLLAILESCAPTHVYFDIPDFPGKTALGISALWRGMGLSLTLLVSTAILLPFHITGMFCAKFFN